MIDFYSHGQRYTQVVVTLVPDKPRLRNGKRIVVVVGAEPGSEYAMDFVETTEGKEGSGVRLARRNACRSSPAASLRTERLPTTRWKPTRARRQARATAPCTDSRSRAARCTRRCSLPRP